jgi:hypothetical protein
MHYGPSRIERSRKCQKRHCYQFAPLLPTRPVLRAHNAPSSKLCGSRLPIKRDRLDHAASDARCARQPSLSRWPTGGHHANSLPEGQPLSRMPSSVGVVITVLRRWQNDGRPTKTARRSSPSLPGLPTLNRSRHRNRALCVYKGKIN